MKDFLKQSYLFIITTSILVFVGVIILILVTKFNLITEKQLSTKTYSLEYDSTWSVKYKRKNQLVLKHKKGPVLKIIITDLTDEYKYDNLSSSIDNILFNIEKDNSNIQLVNKEQLKINNNDSYKVLYKNDKSSKDTLLTIIKQSNKLIICDFSSKDKYFDFLLDSQDDIIRSIKLKEEKINLKSTIDLTTKKIKWNTNKDLSKLIKSFQENSISNMNYHVEYKIPDIFVLNELNTTNSHYTYRLDNSRIELKTNIKNINIYEYLNNNKSKNTIYYNYNNIKDKSNYKEYLSKSDNNTYIYKNSYKDSKYYENVEIIHILDNNHLFIVTINIYNGSIPIKLINNIKLIKYYKLLKIII